MNNLKRLVVGGFIMLSFCVVKPSYAVNNLLSNSDFENGLNSWTVDGPNWQAQSDVVFPDGGLISAENTYGSIPGQDYFASLNQTFAATAGQVYYATLQTKTNINPQSFAVAGVLVQFLNSSNQEITKAQDQIGGGTDWHNVYVSLTAPAGTTQVVFHAFVFAAQADSAAVGGTAYFDQAVLTLDTIAPPANQKDLLNAGFENGLNDWDLIFSPALSVDNTDKAEGLYSTKDTISSISGIDFFSAAAQDLEYQGGPLYASAQIKTNIDPTSTGVAGLLLEYYNQFNPPGGSRIGFDQQVLSGVNDWTRVLLDGVIPPSGTVMVRVLVFTYAVKGDNKSVGGTANFDDVIFSYDPLPVDDKRTDILNGDLENGLNLWSQLFGFPAETSDVAHGGLLAAKKRAGVIPGQDYYSQLYQDIYSTSDGQPFFTGTPVFATAFVKADTDPVTKTKGGIQLEFIDANGNVITGLSGQPIVINSLVGGRISYRYLYVQGNVPSGTYRVRVSGIQFAREQDANKAGDVYYDDFKFSVVNPLPQPNTSRQTLRNARFENGLNDWDELNKPGEISTTVVYAGNYSAFFTLDDGDYFGTASQDLKVLPGQTVTATAWAKAEFDPTTSGTTGIFTTYFDEHDRPIGVQQTDLLGGMQNWSKLKVASTAPAGAVKVRFTCFVFAVNDGKIGDKGYFDNTRVVIK